MIFLSKENRILKMQNNYLDRKTALDIQCRVDRLFKEMGVKEPPLNMDDVMDHLSVDHSYYDLEDPGFLRDVWHKLQIGTHKISKIIKKVELKAIWLPDSGQIVVDNTVPNTKRKWINAHEVTHSIIPTHREFFLGDTAETLDPVYHEMLEAEANFGASELIFIGEKFTLDGLDCTPSFNSIRLLGKTYGNSLPTTLRRFILFSHDIPMIGIISKPWWEDALENGKSRCRYFITSHKFESQFSEIQDKAVFELIDVGIEKRRGGPVGNGIITLKDDNQDNHIFHWESFFNRYDVITLITHLKKI